MNKTHFSYSLIALLLFILSNSYGQAIKANGDTTKRRVVSPQSQNAAKAIEKGDFKSAPYRGTFKQFEYEALKIVFKGKAYTILIVDPEKVEIDLFLPQKKSSLSEMEHLAEVTLKEGKTIKMAMNAGMFDPGLKPLGLFINSGNTGYPINLSTGLKGNFFELTPNGVFVIDSNNVAYIVESTDFNDKFDKIKVKIATQSGPILVVDGKFNKGFNEGSSNLNIRNAVGVTASNRVIFAISDDKVNFYEFAELLRDFLSCDNALYLDGFVSHMYLTDFKRSLANKYPLGPILTITEKTK
jgi:uncharacterized protein YigE (DUF2233 family)